MTSDTIWNPAAETMSVDERVALQADRLRALVTRLAAAPGWSARLQEAGVESAGLRGLDGVAELPTTAKADLWAAYPFGLLGVPREQVARVHGSSGTGGRPTLVGYTRADLALFGEVNARALGCAGARPGTVVHNAYGYGLFTGGLGLHGGAETMGATVVPMSGGQTARQVTLLRDLGAQVLCCTPSYAVFLGEAIRAAGVDSDALALHTGVFGAEPWTEALRRQIEALLPLRAIDIYGLSEIIGPGVACECRDAQAGLHIAEDHFLVECLDPVTGRPVPDGTPGELVFTTLTRQASPVLRYRTGDLASLDRAECPCGRTTTRMSKVLGRRDDMLVLRGVNVFPSEVEAVLLAAPGVAPHYLLVLDERGALAELAVVCEPVEERGPVDDVQLSAALRDRLGVGVRVVLAPLGTLPRTEVGKAVRLVRRTSALDAVPEPVRPLL